MQLLLERYSAGFGFLSCFFTAATANVLMRRGWTSRVRFFLALAAAILLTIAGCVSQPAPEPTPAPDPEPVRDDVWVYKSGGEPLAANGTFATAEYVMTGKSGPEPQIGITSKGNIFTNAYSDILKSADGGRNWTVVHSHTLDNSDPMMHVDRVTDRVFNAPMFPILLCASLYWSDDEGATWTENPSFSCGRTVYDHQKLAAGKPGPDPNPAAGALWDSVLYMCYNGIASTNCGTSYDGGQSWAWDRITAANAMISGCTAGQNGHPVAGPDGTIVFGRVWTCDKPYITFSKDSGATWTVRPGPAFPTPYDGSSAQGINPEIAFTPDGTMYFNYEAPDHHQYLARTKDLGATWDGPWDVTPPGVGSTVFNALVAGSDGRIAMAFLGSDVKGSSSVAKDSARWHLYYVTSDDASSEDPTFTAYQATPDEDPVQVGCVWQGGGGNPCRNLLDFIDAAVHPDGTVYVAYADGCTKGCAGESKPKGDDSRDDELAVAALRGWSAYAAGNATAGP